MNKYLVPTTVAASLFGVWISYTNCAPDMMDMSQKSSESLITCDPSPCPIGIKVTVQGTPHTGMKAVTISLANSNVLSWSTNCHSAESLAGATNLYIGHCTPDTTAIMFETLPSSGGQIKASFKVTSQDTVFTKPAEEWISDE